MSRKVPHDFRAMARQPVPLAGGGAPIQISGTKLQENFEHLEDWIHDLENDGILPEAIAGDMLYFDGTEWVALSIPGSPLAGFVHIIEHDGFAPYFETYQKKVISICVLGVPTEFTILAQPFTV